MKSTILLAALVAVLSIGNTVTAQSEHKTEQAASGTKSDDGSATTKTMEEKPDIVATAMKAGKFSTLVAAVKAAGLVEALQGEGPFTVFAPTDEAFKKIDEATLQDLLKPENKEKLKSILTYHVVSGKVMAADVVGLDEAKTLNGESVTIKANDGVVMVDGAKVIKTDIECGNGVIHVIDSVIMP
ncbi:fasciclin domain-containing protein [Mariniblastus sp.]|nr:fasciclin domain-containing protein [Mariniblastus sp.]